MQSIYYRAADGTVNTDVTEDKLPALLQDKEGVLWLDLGEEPEDKCQKLLSEVFNFHPLAIEDAIAETHAPKVDDWETYLYLVMQVIQREDHTENLLTTVELDCFLGANYLVTYYGA